MSDEDPVYPVYLYVYDLSRGYAQIMAPSLLGFPVEGIWHTSVVVHDVETYYGQGILQSPPGRTHHGAPYRMIDMGTTAIPPEVYDEYLNELRVVFTAGEYNLFDNNCNHMTDQVCQFLVDKSIPEYIRTQPQEVLRTPFGQMLRPMIENAMAPVVQAPVVHHAGSL